MGTVSFQDQERVVRTMVSAIASHNPISSGRWDGGLIHEAVEKLTALALSADPTNKEQMAEVERWRRNLTTVINEAVERTFRIRAELAKSQRTTRP